MAQKKIPQKKRATKARDEVPVSDRILRAARRAKLISPEGAENLRGAFTTWDDGDLACGTLRQCSVEIHVLLAAIESGCNDTLVSTALTGIALRMEAAADLAESDEHEPMGLKTGTPFSSEASNA